MHGSVYHNSWDLNYRKPFGAVPSGQQIRLSIKVESDTNVKQVILRLWSESDGEMRTVMSETEQKGRYYEVFITPSKCELLWYYFIIESEAGTFYYSKSHSIYDGTGRLNDQPEHSFQITVFDQDYKIPEKYLKGVIYQIFPDRFFKPCVEEVNNSDCDHVDKSSVQCKKAGLVDHGTASGYFFHNNWYEPLAYNLDPKTGKLANNDYFGGTLSGIAEKLDYLNELGITIIYLNPIFEAFSNHRYNTADYKKIDLMLGDLSIFQALCKKARRYGISIILDGVFSHTGSDSIYFNKEGRYRSLGAYQSKESKYYPWYNFVEYPDEYDCWWGVKTLPNVNETYPTYMDYIIRDENSVVKYWICQGAAGWRLDVADELPDQFIRELRIAVKDTNPDAVIIGEVWEDASNKISYGKLRSYLLGEELDSVMNYPFSNAIKGFITEILDAEQVYKITMTLYENYPKQAFFGAMNLLGTHDTPRIRTIFGETPDENNLSVMQKAGYKMNEEQNHIATLRQKIAVIIQMTYPGVPSVFYGDEAGMEGYGDPFNRGTYPWGKENQTVLAWYKKWIAFRNETDALIKGEYKPVIYKAGLFGYIRYITNNTDVFGQYAKDGFVLVLVNRDKHPYRDIVLDLNEYSVKSLKNITGEDIDFRLCNGFLHIQLNGLSCAVLTNYEE